MQKPFRRAVFFGAAITALVFGTLDARAAGPQASPSPCATASPMATTPGGAGEDHVALQACPSPSASPLMSASPAAIPTIAPVPSSPMPTITHAP